MAFRPLTDRWVRWRPLDSEGLEGEGLEHLHLHPAGKGSVVARSVVIGRRGGAPYGVRYRIDCDPLWRVRAFEIEVADGRRLALRSDGEGRWQDEQGFQRREFDGCIDVDLAGTPFTNTLPIRRLDPSPDTGTLDLTMLYVPFDTFEPFPDGQRYTALGAGRYLYQAADGSFETELKVDEDGLVTDYPALFARVS